MLRKLELESGVASAQDPQKEVGPDPRIPEVASQARNAGCGRAALGEPVAVARNGRCKWAGRAKSWTDAINSVQRPGPAQSKKGASPMAGQPFTVWPVVGFNTVLSFSPRKCKQQSAAPISLQSSLTCRRSETKGPTHGPSSFVATAPSTATVQLEVICPAKIRWHCETSSPGIKSLASAATQNKWQVSLGRLCSAILDSQAIRDARARPAPGFSSWKTEISRSWGQDNRRLHLSYWL